MVFVTRLVAGEKKATAIMALCLALVFVIATVPLTIHTAWKPNLNDTNASSNSISPLKNKSKGFFLLDHAMSLCIRRLINETLVEAGTEGISKFCLQRLWTVICYNSLKNCSMEEWKPNQGNCSQAFDWGHSFINKKLKSKPIQFQHPAFANFSIKINNSHCINCYTSAWDKTDVGKFLANSLWFSTAFILLIVTIIIFTWQGTTNMRNFPPSGIQMMTIAYIITSLPVIVPQFMGRNKFFCKGKHLYAPQNPTTWCTLSGSIGQFGVIFFAAWWMCSICNIYSTISLFGKKDNVSRKRIVAFWLQLSFCLLAAGIPVGLTFLEGGYIGSSANVVCRQTKRYFETTVLPITAILYAGIITTIGIIHQLRKCTVLKNYFKSGQELPKILALAYQALQERFIFLAFIYPVIASTIITTFGVIIDWDRLFPDYLRTGQMSPRINIKHVMRVDLCLASADLILFDILGLALLIHCLSSSESKYYWSSLGRKLRSKRQQPPLSTKSSGHYTKGNRYGSTTGYESTEIMQQISSLNS